MDDTDPFLRDTRKSALSEFIVAAYKQRRLRGSCFSLAFRLEGDQFYSATARKILSKYHHVTVGAYSYGACFTPGHFDPGTSIGRYVSIGPGVRVFLRNHPYDRLSMHPFFYNSKLGWLPNDNVSFGTLEIGHDAWIGANSIFTPGCAKVGVGAIVGAGSVVTKDVPDFAIVAGNPARVLRRRFAESICCSILESKWWEKPIEEAAQFMNEMAKPLGEDQTTHPLLAKPFAKDTVRK